MSSSNLKLNRNKQISEKVKKIEIPKLENESILNLKTNEDQLKNTELNINNDTQTLYSGNSSLELSVDFSRKSEEEYSKKIKKETLKYVRKFS